MLYTYSVFMGFSLALLIFFNGTLSKYIGELPSLLIIHIIGLLTSSLLVLFQKKKLNLVNIPLWMFLGGILNIFVIYFENICIKSIGISITMLLLISGQVFISLIIDHFAFFNREQSKFNMKKLSGIIVLIIGFIILNI